MDDVIYIARNKGTGKLIFVRLGERYDQSVYDLLFSVSADQISSLIYNLA